MSWLLEEEVSLKKKKKKAMPPPLPLVPKGPSKHNILEKKVDNLNSKLQELEAKTEKEVDLEKKVNELTEMIIALEREQQISIITDPDVLIEELIEFGLQTNKQEFQTHARYLQKGKEYLAGERTKDRNVHDRFAKIYRTLEMLVKYYKISKK